MKRERPILFSTPMVQAILEGRKTMTRRGSKLDFIDSRATEILPCNSWPKQGDWAARLSIGSKEVPRYEVTDVIFCPYGEVGDVLWVRETWRSIEQDWGNPRYEYKATEKINLTDKWRPSIFMPRIACRIYLEITDIRIERLHDITEEDARAEGLEFDEQEKTADNHYHHFSYLWDSINGSGSWEANPWVWVISFQKV